MTKNADKSADIREYLRLLGNPYASLQIGDDEETVSKFSSDEQHPYVRHPYALIPQEENAQEVATDTVARLPVNPAGGALSKAEFRAECRRIFGQYIPALEKGRLRSHHRHFIARNESSSPARRHRLVRHLVKYDLSNTQGFTTHFNREREPLTDEKLKQIERLTDSED